MKSKRRMRVLGNVPAPQQMQRTKRARRLAAEIQREHRKQGDAYAVKFAEEYLDQITTAIESAEVVNTAE